MERITNMIKSLKLFAALAMAASLICSCKGNPAIPQDKELESRVEKTLKGMSLEEKAGQMIQINITEVYDVSNRVFKEEGLDRIIRCHKVGSILNTFDGGCPDAATFAEVVKRIQEVSMEAIGIPCIYGLDMIHGASYYKDATLFPQEVNLGATFNPEFAGALGKAIGYETRAGMVAWVFSPVMDLCRNALWPRNWESFGEDPYLQTVMAATETLAIQGDDPNHIDAGHCGVSLKHYLGYGNPATGKDRTPAYIDHSTLKEKYFPPFKECIEAGAVSVMVNSASINGIPTHANGELLEGWLKEGLDWDGMVVTDWADINNLYTREHIAVDKKDALRLGINAGIDMVMETYDPEAADLICELVREGLVKQSRVDDAVRRILRLKYRLGLFDNPTWDVSGYEMGREEFKEASYRAAVESEVLLKNDGILPLAPGTKILVTGPNANSVRALNGGWTYTWQGVPDGEYYEGFNSIFSALAAKFPGTRYVPTVEYVQDYGRWEAETVHSFAPAVAAARSADVIFACIGENTYCETPGNISDLTLSANQRDMVKALASTGKPVVLVLNEGRARVLNDIEPLAGAVVDVILPGNYGGDALAALVSGEENFSGKLPFTYPKYVNSIHTYDYKVSENVATMDGAYNYDARMDVQWAFADGLSYTTFEYSNLKVSVPGFKAGDVLKVSGDVKNSGPVEGKESVILYSSDLVASLVPDVKRVRDFAKVSLKPGETKTVEFTVPAENLAFVGSDGKWTLEEGDFRLSCGGLSALIHCEETGSWR